MKYAIASLLVLSSAVSANPITDAVKERSWPVYDCTINVNDKNVSTVTDQEQYSKYTLSDSGDIFTYNINDTSELVLIVQRANIFKVKDKYYASAILYKGNKAVQTYNGYCKER